LAKTQQAKSENEGNKESTEKELEEDSAYLKQTEAMCQIKKSDFEAREKLRQGEIDSITKAMNIIETEVPGADAALLQVRHVSRRKTALAHLRSEARNPAQDRMAVFLSERARTLKSTLLLDMAQHVQADPFKKVKKMVKDLIVQLMEEATAEMSKKGWCDTELTKNSMTREKKSDEVEELTQEIEGLNAELSKLGQDNAELTKAIGELDKAMLDETAERQKSKASNKKAIKEAQGAIEAVGQAMSVLKDFYAKSAEAQAFVQANVKEDDAPETFDEPYQGNQEGGGGVVGMLEVVLSDFTRLESETASSEALEADTYKQYMFESAKDRALKANQISLQEGTITDKEGALRAAKTDLKNTQDALDKAIKYYEKLKPDCVDSGISYSERKERREAEIQSLQEALKMLT